MFSHKIGQSALDGGTTDAYKGTSTQWTEF